MPDPKNQHDEPVVFEQANDPIVANPISLVVAQRACELFADLAGIIELLYPLPKESYDATGNGLI